MIRIRYADLPAGLHVRAEARGRSTIIYLLPGLTAAQRRAALGRARRNASLGHGPRLPTAGFAAALLADQVTATLRNGATAFRSHPLLLVPPVIIAVTGTLVYIMLGAVTITIRPPQAGGSFSPPGAASAVPRYPRAGPQADPGWIGDRVGPASAGPPPLGGSTRSPRPVRAPGRSAAPLPSASASASASPSASPPRSPRPEPPGSGTPSPSPTPSPRPRPSPTGKCAPIGPLGVCLKP